MKHFPCPICIPFPVSLKGFHTKRDICAKRLAVPPQRRVGVAVCLDVAVG